jgi:hypothetical protein
MILRVLDLLFIADDIYPAPDAKTPNGRMSVRAALAHELDGHRQTCFLGIAFQAGSYKDEYQASYLASFNAHLAEEDRRDLVLDAEQRLHPGIPPPIEVDRNHINRLKFPSYFQGEKAGLS